MIEYQDIPFPRCHRKDRKNSSGVDGTKRFRERGVVEVDKYYTIDDAKWVALGCILLGLVKLYFVGWPAFLVVGMLASAVETL
jgi:hypothetical protein